MMQTVIGQYIATDLLNAPGRTIAADDDLLTSGLVDSMGIMSLVFFLEQRYGVQIPPGDVTIEHFGTLQSIERYLVSRTP
jgi:acyl carrier protein